MSRIRSVADATYYVSAACTVAGTCFAIAQPIMAGNADGLSLTFVILRICAIVLSVPYFVLRVMESGAPFLQAARAAYATEYTAPMVVKSVLLVLFFTLLGVKIYYMERDDADGQQVP